MAKKGSARSKGYRSYQKEPFHLTKDQWMKIGIAAAALVLVIVLICIFYDDGSLKVKDKKVVTAGDNWLVVNTVDSKDHPKYFKVGESDPAEGFSLDPENGVDYVTDENEFMYNYVPDDADACPVDGYYVMGINKDYSTIAEAGKEQLSGYMTDFAATETYHREVAGVDMYYYYYTYAITESDESTEDTEDVIITGYSENLLAYMGTKRKDCAVMITLSSKIPAVADAAGEDAMYEYLEKAVKGITITDK